MYLHSNQNRDLYTLDLDNCLLNKIGVMPERMFDIAMTYDGIIFAISSNRRLYKINKNDGSGILLKNDMPSLNALVYSADDNLYGADGGGNIYKINPTNGAFVNLGNCGFSSGGDLTFYQGRLYLASGSSELIEIDINRVGRSRLVGNMNASSILGLITVGTTECGVNENKIYATGYNQIYEVDINTAKLKLACTLSLNAIGGAASISESSKIKKSNAGKDSTINICLSNFGTITLSNYINDGETGGIWKNVSKSNSLSPANISTQTLNSGENIFNYIVGKSVCADTSQITILATTSPKVRRIRIRKPSCGIKDGEVEIITENNPEQMFFSLNNQSFQKNNFYDDLEAGFYKLTILNDLGCKTDTTIIMETSSSPEIDSIIIKNSQCEVSDGMIEIISKNALDSLTYSIDSTSFQKSNIFNKLVKGSYEIFVKNSNNCITKRIITLNEDCAAKVFFPNSFTPNRDSFNDAWCIYFTKESLKINKLLIFNRWGEVIYEKSNFEVRSGESLWDGLLNGKAVISGIYTYRCEVQLSPKESFLYRGVIQIIY